VVLQISHDLIYTTCVSKYSKGTSLSADNTFDKTKALRQGGTLQTLSYNYAAYGHA